MQALSLLLAVLLRAMVPARRVDYDSDEDFIVARRPLLSPQGGTTYPTTSGDSKGFHSDFWSSQLRQKASMPLEKGKTIEWCVVESDWGPLTLQSRLAFPLQSVGDLMKNGSANSFMKCPKYRLNQSKSSCNGIEPKDVNVGKLQQ